MMRSGVRFAIDLGAARVGVAKCDAAGLIAAPFGVWPFTTLDELVARVNAELMAWEPLEFVIGLPIDLRGEEGVAAVAVRQQATALAAALARPVRLVDERLTTVTARRRLRETGKSARTDRALIDAAAATVLLEHALELERATGKPPGEVIGD